MPTYEYKCPQCGLVSEIQCKLDENPSLYHCGYNYMIKQISKPAGIHFKGTGFYETDYKNK